MYNAWSTRKEKNGTKTDYKKNGDKLNALYWYIIKSVIQLFLSLTISKA